MNLKFLFPTNALFLGMQNSAGLIKRNVDFPTNIKNKVSYDLAIPLVGMCPK
jgi:hypothetical protein